MIFYRPPAVIDWNSFIVADAPEEEPDWSALLLMQDEDLQGPDASEAEPETERCPPTEALLAQCRPRPVIRLTPVNFRRVG